MSVFAGYTSNSLATDLRGLLNVTPDAPGGPVPDRVLKIVQLAGIRLWGMNDWEFRRVQATLTIADGTSEQDAPNDFAKFDQQWLNETSDKYPIQIHSDQRRYQQFADRFDSDDTGQPLHLVAETKSSSAPHVWQFIWVPEADDEYTFPYWYLRNDPWSRGSSELDDDAAPNWPKTFDEGWKLLSAFGILQDYFPGDDKAANIRVRFREWRKEQVGNVDETSSGGDEEHILDGYGDASATMSAQYGNGLGIGVRKYRPNAWF